MKLQFLVIIGEITGCSVAENPVFAQKNAD